MLRYCVAFVFLAVCSPLVHGQTANNALPTPGNQKMIDNASYAIGLDIGGSIKADRLGLKVDSLVQGIRDALVGAKPRLSEAQIAAALKAFQEMMEAKAEELGKKNIREGQAFLTANTRQPSVKTLPSGLQYTVLRRGNGPTPNLTDSVRVHYHGTLLDGTVFDSSVERNTPAKFEVGGVIRGWTEALQRMNVGSKWRLFVPSELAYGPRGFPPDIGRHAVLIFEVELLGIE